MDAAVLSTKGPTKHTNPRPTPTKRPPPQPPPQKKAAKAEASFAEPLPSEQSRHQNKHYKQLHRINLSNARIPHHLGLFQHINLELNHLRLAV